MSVDLKKMETGVDSKDLFHHWERDQMISSKEDRKFFFKKDHAKGLPNQSERELFLSKG
jgi:hypothetical protein